MKLIVTEGNMGSNVTKFSLWIVTLLHLGLSACAIAPQSSEKKRATQQFDLGVNLYMDQRYPESLTFFRNARALDHTQAAYPMHEALALHKLERFEEARKLMTETCNKNSFAICWNNMSYLLREQRHYNEAADAARKALSFPTYESPQKAWINLGLAQFYAQVFNKAEKSFLKAIELEKSNCIPHILLSRNYLTAARFNEAQKESQISVSLCPSKPEVLFWNAYTHYKSGRIKEAHNLYSEIASVLLGTPNGLLAAEYAKKIEEEEPISETSLKVFEE